MPISSKLDKTLHPITRRFNGLVPQVKPGDATKWQVGIGAGQIADAYTDPISPIVREIKNTTVLEYSKPSALNGTTVTAVYAYYYWSGTAIAIGYQTAAPIADDLVDRLFLAAIISSNGTTITELRPISLADEPETKTLLDRGCVNLDRLRLNPVASSMRLASTGGRLKFAGRNAYVNPKLPHTLTYEAIATISYFLCDSEGNILQNETNFNFNRFWNGSAIAPLSSTSYASVQFLYLFPSGVFAVVLGINQYTSLPLAVEQWRNWETFRPLKFKNNTCFLGAIAGLGSATNINNTNEVLIAYAD